MLKKILIGTAIAGVAGAAFYYGYYKPKQEKEEAAKKDTAKNSGNAGGATDSQFDELLKVAFKNKDDKFLGVGYVAVSTQKDKFKKNLTSQDADALIAAAKNKDKLNIVDKAAALLLIRKWINVDLTKL